MNLWFCDLTYTQQTIAADVFPAATASIACYIEQEIPGLKNCTAIFKYPESLISSFSTSKDLPDVIFFSNYIWNHRLSLLFSATNLFVLCSQPSNPSSSTPAPAPPSSTTNSLGSTATAVQPAPEVFIQLQEVTGSAHPCRNTPSVFTHRLGTSQRSSATSRTYPSLFRVRSLSVAKLFTLSLAYQQVFTLSGSRSAVRRSSWMPAVPSRVYPACSTCLGGGTASPVVG